MKPSISIAFIRDIGSKNNDDRIIITKGSEDTFDVSIKYAGIAYGISEHTCFDQNIKASNLKKYVRSLLVLSMHDADPYDRVQIDMPNAPSVLLKINPHLCEGIYEAVDELIEVSIVSWPRAF